MNKFHPDARVVRRIWLALASVALLTGCISSNEPLLTDGQPLLGKRTALTVLRFTRWRGARAERRNLPLAGRPLRPGGGNAKDIGPFTLHAFDGSDLIVQSIRPGKPVEYGIARKLADGVYLLIAVDESDATQRRRINFARRRRPSPAA